MKITLKDLTIAYRKAKVDIFYSTISRREDLMRYESDLLKNLNALLEKIDNEEFDFTEGSWTAFPAAIELNYDSTDTFSSDSWDRWSSLSEECSPTLKLRVMESLPIDFHVLSSLWIQKVGNEFDKELSESVYGNRLRRKKPVGNETIGELNHLSLGNFNHYLTPYQNWRSDGVSCMKESLESKKRITAITADVSSYYHSLDVSFMLDQEFLKQFKFPPRGETLKLHTYFINQLAKWSQETPFQKGLPVGLSASNVIANLALKELDEVILQELNPLHYGRYVDDIILILPSEKAESKVNLWKRLHRGSKGLLRREKSSQGSELIRVVTSYLKSSSIYFENEKNKIFNLHGLSGTALLQKIEENFAKNSSEWRGMPEVPEDSDQIPTDLTDVLSGNGDNVTTLRDADKATTRKSKFAIQLRDYEAYGRAMPPSAWSEQRSAFIKAFTELIVTPCNLIDFVSYLPRVLTLGIVNEDYAEIKQMLLRLADTLNEISRLSSIELKQPPNSTCPVPKGIEGKWHQVLKNQIFETFLAASSKNRLGTLRDIFCEDETWEHPVLAELFWEGETLSHRFIFAQFRTNLPYNLFAYDLGNIPYRNSYLPEELRGYDTYPRAHEQHSYTPIENMLDRSEISIGVHCLLRFLNINPKKDASNEEGEDTKKEVTLLPCGFLFPTRPFHLHELHLLHPDPFNKQHKEKYSAILLSQRGYSIHPEDLPTRDPEKEGRYIKFPNKKGTKSGKLMVGITSWLTEDKSWEASVFDSKDPDKSRFHRLCHLAKLILNNPTKPDYVIFPELSLKPSWFIPLAMKFNRAGISLIAGVEYIHPNGSHSEIQQNVDSEQPADDNYEPPKPQNPSVVNNQVWVSLPTHNDEFAAFSIYRQDKKSAAIHEERQLYELANKQVLPKRSWKTPPILVHGEFRFSLLICSEFSNIEYRASLRGEIDTLFIPQWNQDTESFNSLVESSASDIHTYIVQCNNRKYGDSRIRKPAKERYDQDVIRLKGGVDDYLVVGEVDITALRKFQTHHRSPKEPFKPVPDGFEINPSRKYPKA
ncbi:RNA-directed DNA polymerase [Rubritalea marina]|uniref:RNA-directed DNA polymerase n=1 Tax=Rubritalea marina TaxID=361055 RepID=UPI0003618EBF|nr:RNA-directed DNA polymerase [Rubritalea marina]